MIILNGRYFNVEKFPNNETLLRDYIPAENENEIKLKFESDSDFMTLLFIKKHIDNLRPNSVNKLIIPYMPYSRMDRTEGVNIFTLKILCQFINSLGFDEVVIYEPHSNVCEALIDRLQVVNQSAILLKDVMENLKFGKDGDYILYPDGGAEKRYSKQIKYDKVLTASKERDFLSGRIKCMKINEQVQDLNRAIIIDDLCSKGGTFMMSANILKELGAKEIYLVVAHCENTIQEGEILTSDLINKVYTTDSIITEVNVLPTLRNKISITKIF